MLECHAPAGDTDLLIRVVATSPDDLYRVSEEIRLCPGIVRTSTSMFLREVIPYRTTGLLGTDSGPPERLSDTAQIIGETADIPAAVLRGNCRPDFSHLRQRWVSGGSYVHSGIRRGVGLNKELNALFFPFNRVRLRACWFSPLASFHFPPPRVAATDPAANGTSLPVESGQEQVHHGYESAPGMPADGPPAGLALQTEAGGTAAAAMTVKLVVATLVDNKAAVPMAQAETAVTASSNLLEGNVRRPHLHDRDRTRNAGL